MELPCHVENGITVILKENHAVPRACRTFFNPKMQVNRSTTYCYLCIFTQRSVVMQCASCTVTILSCDKVARQNRAINRRCDISLRTLTTPTTAISQLRHRQNLRCQRKSCPPLLDTYIYNLPTFIITHTWLIDTLA